MNIQVLGLCRFSLIVNGGFQTGPTDPVERAAFLFEETRLAGRFAWFEELLIPSLQHQDDDRFRFVVLASSALPVRWQNRLREAVADCPQVEVEFAEPGPHNTVTNSAIQRRIDPRADAVAQFRLDDDDGLARSYIRRVHTDFEEVLLPLFQRFSGVSCDYSRGLILEADGTSARLQQSFVHAWTCAQTVYLPPDASRTLFDMAHHRHFRHMPTVSLQDSIMFLRGRHGTNDSGLRLHPKDTRDWDMASLQKLFGMSLDRLQAALRGEAGLAPAL